MNCGLYSVNCLERMTVSVKVVGIVFVCVAGFWVVVILVGLGAVSVIGLRFLVFVLGECVGLVVFGVW